MVYANSTAKAGEIMEIYMPMATTERHNLFTGTFFGCIMDLVRKAEIKVFHNEGALVYLGTRKDIHRNLIDINNFNVECINDLEYVQPDFMLFKDNKFVQNERKTRIAGCPDLIVEIWSDSNTSNERALKKNLYATGINTEHWYIEQDSNIVECYIGEKKTANKSLKDMLITNGGIEFDLRYLAL